MSQESFLKSYIEAALWSSVDDNEEPLDKNFTADDLHASALSSMRVDCSAFSTLWQDEDREDPDAQAGHDFWLTRNGQGAGFWDRDFHTKKVGEQLTKAARVCGVCNIYLGDDGSLYVC